MPKLAIRPESASAFAPQYDALFMTLTALATLFSVGVIGMALFFAVRYREGSNVRRKRPERENLRLESVLIGGPLVLGLGIFFWGARLYATAQTPPRNAMEIFVIGKQWMWHIQHPDGIREMNELTVPLNRPVRFTMISQDVIHSFFVPEFRAQYQVVPGRYTSLWFTPTKAGRFLLLCNLYCGTDHSRMVGHVNVLPPREYQAWVAAQERPVAAKPVATLVDQGRALFAANACGRCHGATDGPNGPALRILDGAPRTLTNGDVVQVSDEYLRLALLSPQSEVVAGYSTAMPAYQGLTEEEILALIAYLKSSGPGGAK